MKRIITIAYTLYSESLYKLTCYANNILTVYDQQRLTKLEYTFDAPEWDESWVDGKTYGYLCCVALGGF